MIFKRRNKSKGEFVSPVYNSWSHMKERCLNKRNKNYDLYGGRGISVCDRWLKFENFYADMGDPPAGMTIERIDNNGDYELSNCKWATRMDQVLNRSATRMITFKKKTMCMKDWARHLGINYVTLKARIDSGMPFDIATQPFDNRTGKMFSQAKSMGSEL